MLFFGHAAASKHHALNIKAFFILYLSLITHTHTHTFILNLKAILKSESQMEIYF
jgi:hypothetical protein